jgi:hypothetical protein
MERSELRISGITPDVLEQRLSLSGAKESPSSRTITMCGVCYFSKEGQLFWIKFPAIPASYAVIGSAWHGQIPDRLLLALSDAPDCFRVMDLADWDGTVLFRGSPDHWRAQIATMETE